MINQLRLYRINPDLKDVFLARFRDHAARIMRERYGFRIVAMWLSDEQNDLRFVYILSWPDLAAKEDAWKRFMADEEWSEIKRVTRETTGEPVQGIEDILLNAVEFSMPLDVQNLVWCFRSSRKNWRVIFWRFGVPTGLGAATSHSRAMARSGNNAQAVRRCGRKSAAKIVQVISETPH